MNNGNGSWFHSVWKKGGARDLPKKSGWYAVRPECCQVTLRVMLAPNLYDVFPEGDDLKHDVYDYEWWYPLKHQHDPLPEFR